jgi:hypothetical protein
MSGVLVKLCCGSSVGGFWLSYWALEKRVSTLFMGCEPISLSIVYFSTFKFVLVHLGVWCTVASNA